MKVSAVVFDLDGTLVDFEILSHEAVQTVLSDHDESLIFSWELHGRVLGHRPLGPEGWASIILNELEVHESILTPEDFAEKVNIYLKPRYKTVEIMPGGRQLMSRLFEERIPMAIGTSSNRYAVKEKFSNYPELLDMVQGDSEEKAIACGDDPEVKNGKPAPDIFLCAARKLGFDICDSEALKSIVVFEDSISGVKAAKAAGMTAVAVPDKRLFDEKSAMIHFEMADLILHSGLSEFTKNVETNL